MARRRIAEEPQGQPEVDPATAIRLLTPQIQKGRELLGAPQLPENPYYQWLLVTENLLVKAFGRNSPNVLSVTDIGKYGSFPMEADEEWYEQHRRQSLESQLSRMEGLIELLNTEVSLRSGGGIEPPGPKAGGHTVFLVHGHHEGLLHEAARFLEKLKQKVIVLLEQPNQGRTIIEKFEDYSDVGYAVVLLTADDRGGTVDAEFKDQRPRARQNVILELGYFLGRLTRARVCALYQAGVEIPSDYKGVLYVELDGDGAWRFRLAKELKAAGLPVDLNDAV